MQNSRVLLVMLRTGGEPVLRAVLPTFAGLGLLCAVLFGPTGLTPGTVVEAEAAGPATRLGLWAIWLSASVGATRVALLGSGLGYFRALPVSLARHLTLAFGLATAVHMPWIALFGLGGGALSAARVGALALAIAGVLATAPAGWLGHGARAGALVGLGALLWRPLGAPIDAAIGVAAFAVAGYLAWARAPERNYRSRRVVGGGPLLALAASGVAHVFRRRRSHAERALLLAAFGALSAALLARSNDVVDPASLSALALGVGALVLSFGAGSVAVALVEHERAARWLLDSTGTPAALRALATAVPLAIGVGVLGACVGVGVSVALGELAARAVATSTAAGVAWSLIALAVVRRCERRDGIDGTRAVSLLLLLALAMIVGLIALGDAALVALIAVGCAAALIGNRRVEAPAQAWSPEP
jgi:hypothetical protein